MERAKENDKVKVHYVGKLKSGQIFDTSKERDPLEFTVGEGRLIKGFEEAVVGMEVNETKSIDIPKDEAYGERSEELIQEVPKQSLPEDINPKQGMVLVSTDTEGKKREVVVSEVKNESIVIDANHPLAGRDLTFDITLVDING